MASNAFGTIFVITTFGESHGKAMGVVIDGCPAGLPITEEEINTALAKRAPGKSPYTSPRKEEDKAEILSGLFEGKTTGAPICIIIPNKDADSSKYEGIKDVLRPGHANYTYLEKYGIFDYRGGGRASARETVCRVAAGAIAKKVLEHHGIFTCAYLNRVGDVQSQETLADYGSPIFCRDKKAEESMILCLEKAKKEGDSLGGVVEFVASVPAGLGDPVYEKLEAKLAHAMLSIPASKGIELGSGFSSVRMQGSEHNDLFVRENGVKTKTNHAGGTLGGISTGMPLQGRVAFKPTSSIRKEQETLNIQGEKSSFILPKGSRHDPCVAIRAVPVVEAMLSLVLVDSFLLNRSVSL
jgi:chorismate synthase